MPGENDPMTPNNPRLINCTTQNQNGGWVISGEVTDSQHPDDCTILLSSSIPALNNITCNCAEGGLWTHTAVLENDPSGSLQAVATDPHTGLESLPWNSWIG